MSVSVALRFVPPDEKGLMRLHIWESSTPDGVFAEIDSTTNIGAYPNYLDHFTTPNAQSRTNWFAIQWEDAGGALSDLSAPLQGGSQTLVGIVIDRVVLRDPSLTEAVVAQEAEAAISDYYHVVDPYLVSSVGVSPKILSGLTYLTLARSYISRMAIAQTATSKWAAGIVSMDNSSAAKTASSDMINNLLKYANHDLGRAYSVVMLMKEMEVAGGFKRLQSYDVSRMIIEIS